jgi:hypothetical protein
MIDMQKDRGGRLLAIVAICIAVAGLSIAYAALSSTLTINGTATVTPASWGVEFVTTSLSSPTTANGGLTGAASITTTPTITTTSITGYDLGLTKPGDSVTYTFDVHNKGTIDAKITDFSFLTPTYTATATGDPGTADVALVTENLKMTLTYNTATTAAQTGTIIAADAAVAKDQILKAGQTITLKLVVSYDMAKASTALPSDKVTVSNYGATIVYGQA